MGILKTSKLNSKVIKEKALQRLNLKLSLISYNYYHGQRFWNTSHPLSLLPLMYHLKKHLEPTHIT